jgi:hypothetical protein
MMKRIGELKAENARLEHVVNYWKVEAETDNARWLRVLEENERLKAEVERLTLHIELDEVDRRNGLCCDAKYRFQELEEQVERMTKMGNLMADLLTGNGYPQAMKDWKAAKKGGQS